MDPETAEARGVEVRATACPCDEPPWRVDARAARLEPDGDLLLVSPTLRVGDVPVLWLPVLLVRTGREPALHLPSIGYRGADGVLLGTGAYLPLSDADVNVDAKWATAGRLQTSASADLPETHVDVVAFRGDARVRARGHEGPIAFEVDRATSPRIVDRLSPTLQEAARADLHSAAFASFPVGSMASVAAGGVVHGDALVLPRLFATAGGPLLGSGILTRWTLLTDADAATGAQRADLYKTLEARSAAGPLRLGAEASGRATGWRGDTDAARATAGAGADVSMPLERHFGSRRHEIVPSVAYRSILSDLGRGAHASRDDLDRISPRHRIDAALETRLDDVAHADLVASASDAPFGSANVVLGPARAGAAFDPTRETATLLEAAVGVTPGRLEVDVGWRRIRPGASPLTVEDADAFVGADPFALARPSDEAWGGAGVRFPFGLRLGGEARYDLVAAAPSFVAARAGWSARCHCLSVDAIISNRAGRDLPDAFLTVTAR